MNSKEELAKILDTMDIPLARRNDMGWLMRNIQVRNQEHPQIGEALMLIKLISKEQK